MAAALVIIPTYNEIENIEEVTKHLFAAAPDVDLLVIDDGSPDGTAARVEELAADDGRVNLLRRAGKLGLGTAYLTGFRWGLERGYEAMVEMDADMSHDPADVPRLLAALDDADLAIGSRYVSGGAVRDWDPRRRWLSLNANRYVRTMLRIPVRDSTAGFRAYAAKTLGEIDLDSIRSNGYAFQIEMTRQVVHAGAKIAEVPIVFTERREGVSKMSLRITIEALLRVALWGVRDLVGRRR